jgi:hypothetical protein
MRDCEILQSDIVYRGQKVTLACDGRCDKAFGINQRPTNPDNLDDEIEYLADDEVGIAPKFSRALEGGQDKPQSHSAAHNKWCARQCERSVLVDPGEEITLPDFSKRQNDITEMIEFVPEPMPEAVKALLSLTLEPPNLN